MPLMVRALGADGDGVTGCPMSSDGVPDAVVAVEHARRREQGDGGGGEQDGEAAARVMRRLLQCPRRARVAGFRGNFSGSGAFLPTPLGASGWHTAARQSGRTGRGVKRRQSGMLVRRGLGAPCTRASLSERRGNKTRIGAVASASLESSRAFLPIRREETAPDACGQAAAGASAEPPPCACRSRKLGASDRAERRPTTRRPSRRRVTPAFASGAREASGLGGPAPSPPGPRAPAPTRNENASHRISRLTKFCRGLAERARHGATHAPSGVSVPRWRVRDE